MCTRCISLFSRNIYIKKVYILRKQQAYINKLYGYLLNKLLIFNKKKKSPHFLSVICYVIGSYKINVFWKNIYISQWALFKKCNVLPYVIFTSFLSVNVVLFFGVISPEKKPKKHKYITYLLYKAMFVETFIIHC